MRAALAAIALVALAPPGLAADPPPDLALLVERARTRSVATSLEWLALLHYERGILTPRARSRARSDAFYLSPDGRTHPHAELVATLAFFSTPPPENADGEDPRCAFIARFHFLDRALDLARVPPLACPAFEAWRRELAAVGVTMIFPEAFLNNPASMFGHTLLRLDQAVEQETVDYLGKTIDFAAQTGEESALVYIPKGVLGIYSGRFGLHPYYQQLERYSDWENRDVWEYRLALSNDEIERLLMHLWELEVIEFPYYFFDQNCSYHLLRLLDVARPDLRLSRGFPTAVNPIDTVRRLVRPGLVSEVRYRPSPLTELRHALRHLTRDERTLARHIARGRRPLDDPTLAALSPPRRAMVLSVAYDYLRYAFLSGSVAEEESRSLSRQILIARSRLGTEVGQEALWPPVPRPKVRPDESHGSSMLGVGGGFENGQGFVSLRGRLALHDLIDPAGGFIEGAKISLLSGELRYLVESKQVRLHELVAMEVISIAPRDAFVKPISWTFSTGLRTRYLPRDSGGVAPKYAFQTDGGIGLAHGLGPHILAYGFGEAILQLSGSFQNAAALGPGARVGAWLRVPGDRWRGHLYGSVARLFVSNDATLWQAGLSQRLTLQRNAALVLDASYNRTRGEQWASAGLGLRIYF